MPTRSEAGLWIGSMGYGVLVFGGAAVLGFVVAPPLASWSGLFQIDVEAQAFFSLLTLKAVPWLAGLATLSAALHPRLRERPLRTRAALLATNVLVVWLLAVAMAFAILG